MKKMKNEKKKSENRYDIFEFDENDESSSVASATECTGLIQIPPRNEDEAKSYGSLYTVPEQINDFSFVKEPKGRFIKSAPRKMTKKSKS